MTGVNVLAHRADTDVCEAWFSLDIPEASGEVHSILDKESTPEKLSEQAEMVYQSLNESGVVLSPRNIGLLSCDKMPFFLSDHFRRALEN